MMKLVGYFNHCEPSVMYKGVNVPKVDGKCSTSCRILQCAQLQLGALCRFAKYTCIDSTIHSPLLNSLSVHPQTACVLPH